MDQIKRSRETLGWNIRLWRKRRALTLKEVAERTGLSVSHISEVERGMAGISLHHLFLIWRAIHGPAPNVDAAFLGAVIRDSYRAWCGEIQHPMSAAIPTGDFLPLAPTTERKGEG
jgi:hypothetical protein